MTMWVATLSCVCGRLCARARGWNHHNLVRHTGLASDPRRSQPSCVGVDPDPFHKPGYSPGFGSILACGSPAHASACHTSTRPYLRLPHKHAACCCTPLRRAPPLQEDSEDDGGGGGSPGGEPDYDPKKDALASDDDGDDDEDDDGSDGSDDDFDADDSDEEDGGRKKKRQKPPPKKGAAGAAAKQVGADVEGAIGMWVGARGVIGRAQRQGRVWLERQICSNQLPSGL